MLVRHFSTNVPGNCHPGYNLALPIRSDINELVDQAAGIGPDSMSLEDTLSDNGESLYLNVTQTDDALVIEAELSDFGPDDVDVSFQHGSLIITVCRCEEPNRSYYLGDYSQPACRWTIPIDIEIDNDTVKTHFRGGNVIISIMKSVQRIQPCNG